MYPQTTRKTLLDRVKAGDELAWNEFYESYRSLVWLKGTDYRLTEAEQQDLLSDVMFAFFNAQGNFVYDPSKGKFRYYFRKLIVSCCIKILKRRLPSDAEDDAAPPEEVEPPEDPAEWQAFLLRQAIQEAKQYLDSRKMQCFLRCKYQGESPVEVARDLNISLATAYNYCNDVIAEIRILIRLLEKKYGE